MIIKIGLLISLFEIIKVLTLISSAIDYFEKVLTRFFLYGILVAAKFFVNELF